MPTRKRKTTTIRRKPRRRISGRGIGSFFKNLWSKAKSGVSSLWNNNKDMLKARALGLASQARDKALDYAREKKLLSSTVNKILPSKFGIDKLVSGYVSNKTGMGRRIRKKKVGRPKKRYGKGLFDSLKNIGNGIIHTMTPCIVEFATKKLLGGRRRKTIRKPIRRTRRGKGMFSSLLASALPF